jgi:hypothetical protein
MTEKLAGDVEQRETPVYRRRRRPPLWKIVQQIMDEMERQSATAGKGEKTKEQA